MATTAAEENTVITKHDKEILKQIFNPGLPYGDEIDEDEVEKDDESGIPEEDLKKVKVMESQAVRAAEQGDVDGAIKLFDQAVDIAPTLASSYNNRAQALRLKGRDTEAMRDLEKALELSSGRGTSACQAFTQRGLLKKRDGDEQGAREDFAKAADLGGAFAKQLLASMNPYAALCNQMLGQVIQQIRSGEGEI